MVDVPARGPDDGYFFPEFGDQTKVLPGFTPPSNGYVYVYGCSQDYNEHPDSPRAWTMPTSTCPMSRNFSAACAIT